MAGVRWGVRTGEAEGVTATEGMGGDVGMSAVRPRGERRLPMVILLGETMVPLEPNMSATPAFVTVMLGLGGDDETEREDCCCVVDVEEDGRCGLVCVPVEALDAEVVDTTAPAARARACDGLEATPSCLGGVRLACSPAVTFEVALAGECFICWRKFGFSGVIVTPPPGGFGAMGTGDRRTEAAVPPGEKSCRRAFDPGDVSLSCKEERGDSRTVRKPRDLSLGWISGDVPDVLIPPIGVGKATSLYGGTEPAASMASKRGESDLQAN